MSRACNSFSACRVSRCVAWTSRNPALFLARFFGGSVAMGVETRVGFLLPVFVVALLSIFVLPC
jgi:hypothetical protein